MYLDLNELNNRNIVEFKYDVLKDDTLDKRIIDLKNSVVEGFYKENALGIVEIDCTFSGTMIIKDSISLEDITYDFNININANINEIEENYVNCFDKLKNRLDLKEILWQNIVLEVPISYTKVSDANMKGNGWELVDENKEVKDKDPRQKKLEELLER